MALVQAVVLFGELIDADHLALYGGDAGIFAEYHAVYQGGAEIRAECMLFSDACPEHDANYGGEANVQGGEQLQAAGNFSSFGDLVKQNPLSAYPLATKCPVLM